MAQPPEDGLSWRVVGVAPAVRLVVAGELDCATAPRLRACLEELLDAGGREVDVDLAGLTLLAAAGLTVFREIATRLERAGGRLRLTAVPARVRRVLAITGLETVLTVLPAEG